MASPEQMQALLAQADEREAQVKEAFANYDKDASGSIDRCELTMLLDDLHLLAGLSADQIEETISRRLVEADVNADGTLDFEEFKLFYNGVKDAALDAAPSTGSAESAARDLDAEAVERKRREVVQMEQLRKQRQERRGEVLWPLIDVVGTGAVTVELMLAALSVHKAVVAAPAREQFVASVSAEGSVTKNAFLSGFARLEELEAAAKAQQQRQAAETRQALAAADLAKRAEAAEANEAIRAGEQQQADAAQSQLEAIRAKRKQRQEEVAAREAERQAQMAAWDEQRKAEAQQAERDAKDEAARVIQKQRELKAQALKDKKEEARMEKIKEAERHKADKAMERQAKKEAVKMVQEGETYAMLQKTRAAREAALKYLN